MATLEKLFQQYRPGYENNWRGMQIRRGSVDEAKKEAARLLQHKAIYQQIETITGVPVPFTALVHYRESSSNFNTYLGNG